MSALLKNATSRTALPLLAAAAALTAFGLGQLGALSPVFDLAAQFSAHWLIIIVFALAASFATRHAYLLLALSVPAAVMLPAALAVSYGAGEASGTAVAATPFRQTSPTDAAGLAAPPASIKLLAFNTYNANTRLDALAREVGRHNADVVLLTEFGPNKQALIETLARRYAHHASCSTDWDCGLALFSRLPVDRFEIISPGDDIGPSVIIANIRVGTRQVTLIGTHILSPNHGPRANFIELDHLARRVRATAGPVIVAGDLNTTVWAHAFTNFRSVSGLAHMGALVPTWPVANLPLAQIGIDHVLVSNGITVTKVRTGQAAGSDHLPLVATLSIPQS